MKSDRLAALTGLSTAQDRLGDTISFALGPRTTDDGEVGVQRDNSDRVSDGARVFRIIRDAQAALPR